jgi:ferritin-like metal-binding protein YciE
MPITTMEEKFLHDLGAIYDAEQRFLEAQQELAKAANASDLKQMIYTHIGQTQQHIANLEQVYRLLDQKAKREACEAAAGLVSEGQNVVKQASDAPEVLDCLIVGAVAKVEHYEIASYQGLIAHAEQIKPDSLVKLLKENLKQEDETAKAAEKSAPKLIEKAMQVRRSDA